MASSPIIPFVCGVVFSLSLTHLLPSLWSTIVKVWNPKDIRHNHYGIDHILLNLSYNSTWLNFGYWKDDGNNSNNINLSFSTACARLAELVGNSAAIAPQDTVLDLAFGCGDQILLWCAKFRPKRVIGFTLEQIHLEIAQKKLQHSLFMPEMKETDVSLYIGDAVKETKRLIHESSESISKIISVDAAYHFDTRAEFLQNSYLILQKGGRITLTDIVVTEQYQNMSLYTKLMWKLFKIPSANLITLEEYQRLLETIGYKDIEISTIEDYVLLGFVQFIKRHRQQLSPFVRPEKWIGFSFVSSFLDQMVNNRRIHYLLVTATK